MKFMLKDRQGILRTEVGRAGGGWRSRGPAFVGPKGRVIAVDLLPMAAIPGVTFIQGDFNDPVVFKKLQDEICAQGAAVDLVISDMAPNISGEKSIDQPRSLHLVELAGLINA